MADVIDAQGVVITFADNLAAAQIVGGIDTFEFGNGEASDIDITTLSSTAMEWQQGLQDFGAFTLNLKLRDPNDVGQAAMEEAKAARATRAVTVTFLSGDVATFSAYCKSITTSGGVDSVASGSANLKVTGNVVWS